MSHGRIAALPAIFVWFLLSLPPPRAGAAAAPDAGTDAIFGKLNGLIQTTAPTGKQCDAGKV